MRFIDPDGRDIYQVNENGVFIQRVENRNFDQFQVVSVDKDGNKTVTNSEEYKYGTVMGSRTNQLTGKKDKEGPINTDIYLIKGSEEGEKIHQFLSNNTKVEFGRWDLNIFKDGANINIIGTGHRKDAEKSSFYVREGLIKLNMLHLVNVHDHNHPRGNPRPSGTNDGDISGDAIFIKKIEDINPFTIFRIYTKDKGYFYYDSFGLTTTPISTFGTMQKK